MAETNDSPLTLLDLPVDLLVLIFPLLDAHSFLSLTSTCHALHRPDFIHDSSYWSALVRRDFRVPNQPVVQNDGLRWLKLYKRLRTQSRVFTWGNDDRDCLGHSQNMPNMVFTRGGAHARRTKKNANFPIEMEGIEHLGVISDLQSGGWSTTLLTAKGALYTVGVLDGGGFTQESHATATPLRFPPGMPQPKDRYDPVTAIKQFSSGRSHVLAVSDSGAIWSFQNIDFPGVRVKFVHYELEENGRERGRGVVRKVVAGWNRSAALIEGSGIILWEPIISDDSCEVGDAVLVLDSVDVPGTRHVQNNGSNEDQEVGEVQSFIVLEDCILFNTHLGKLFAAEITVPHRATAMLRPIEIPIPTKEGDGPDASFITDIQGSFRNFACFTKSGAVLTSNQDSIMPLFTSPHSVVRIFKRIPALQNKGAISIAFGDYHFHALHSGGHITSYGYEPQSCGALGLGGFGAPEGRLRGIRNQGMPRDGRLVPHAYVHGRAIWFEAEKREWVKFLTSGGVDQGEAAERIRMSIGSPGIDAQGEVSEWIEQEGRDWEEKYGISREDDDGLGAFFALSVSAAGWHSGALVLVNQDMVERLKRAVEVPDDGTANNDPGDDEARSIDDKADAGPSSMIPPEQASDEQGQSLWDNVADYTRYFLGMAPYNVTSATYDPNAVHLRHNTTATANRANTGHQNPRAMDYGASPREGYLYRWAQDHFPRLRLRDGTEMPGAVPFDEWRYGRPDWHALDMEL